MRFQRLLGCLLLALGFALALCVAARPAYAVPELRLGSSDAVTTAVAVSRSAFSTGAPAAVLASTWHDQVCATALAGAMDAPLLVAAPDDVAAPVLAELTRTGATRAVLVGGFTEAAAAQVRSAMPTGSHVTTIAGSSAEKTSELVAERVVLERGSAPEFVLVAPLVRPDLASALAVPAYARGWPVVFAGSVEPSAPARIAAHLGASSALVLDGLATGYAAADALDGLLGPSAVERVAYADAPRAAWGVGEWAVARADLGYARPVFAPADDATAQVVAGTLAARRGSLAVAVPRAGVPSWLAGSLFARRAGLVSNAFVGELPARRMTDVRHAQKAPLFSEARAMAHVKALADLGPRRAGTLAERRAARYVAAQLRSYGYTTSVRKVRVVGGRTSYNVIAEKRGTTSDVIVLGAHMDSKYPSPGANDNASGVGVTLELARILADATVAPTVRFIAFGAEEIVGSKPTNHHFGSRAYVRSLTRTQRARIEAMLSIDMVGYGRTFTVRNLRVAPMTAVNSLRRWGSYTGQSLVYLRDPSRDGWSDHEAFEFRGIPVAWLEWRSDWAYHTRADTYAHVSANRVGRTGRLVRGWLLDLTPGRVDALR